MKDYLLMSGKEASFSSYLREVINVCWQPNAVKSILSKQCLYTAQMLNLSKNMLARCWLMHRMIRILSQSIKTTVDTGMFQKKKGQGH